MKSAKPLIAGGVAAAVVALGATSFAVVNAQQNDRNVTICHATSAFKNPYQVNTVDPSSTDFNGHGDHNGPLFDPDADPKTAKWGDIIPPIPSRDYPGLNWPAGQAIWEAGCKVVVPEPTTPEPTTPEPTTPEPTTPEPTTPEPTTPEPTTPEPTTPPPPPPGPGPTVESTPEAVPEEVPVPVEIADPGATPVESDVEAPVEIAGAPEDSAPVEIASKPGVPTSVPAGGGAARK